jgi:tetratricopeptide (TPR) repeat protein
MLGTLSGLLLERGDVHQALLAAREALSIARAAYAEGIHPAIAIRLSTLGNALFAAGRLAEAESIYHEAIDIFDKSGRSHRDDERIARSNLALVRRKIEGQR